MATNPQEPKEFSMKDLFIDVELKVCSNGTTFDFLGRKLFNTSFFRKDTGFGITNIDIEVNTSLQPLVVVTLKDLYGNTVYAEQSRTADPDDNQSIDYSVLFDWPPPKFLFSFKGYLGNPVSWLLNLKRTSTSFNSSDGSYEIKCEFVPNQWGFFADLPMLFLLAAKPLRRDRIGSNATLEQKRKITSVYDLIKIGKQVEVKTQDTTKEFDKLVKQLGSMKSSIGTALTGSRIISFGETINGVVNNIQVKGFQTIEIPDIKSLGAFLDTEEKINRKLGNASSLSKLNTYLLLSLKIDNKSGFNPKEGVAIANSYSDLDINNASVSEAKNAVIEKININLKLIDDEIKRRVFNTSSQKLEKITIGEVFSQLARDSAFILGSILDAGVDGYYSNKTARDKLSEKLIGEAFPLIINEDGEEVPATDANLKNSNTTDSIKVDSFEMDFVRRFINAISEGIAKDMSSDDLAGANQDYTLKARINNLEMAAENPYKPFYQNIAINVLVRGGIVGFLTRSNDPNYPGEFAGGFSDFFDRDQPSNIVEIATRDATNITDSILRGLSDIDTMLLRRFCVFFKKFYDESGTSLIDEKGESTDVFPSPDSKIIMSNSNDNVDVTLTFNSIWNELRKPTVINNLEITDLDTFGELGPSNPETGLPEDNSGEAKPVEDGVNEQNALSFVNDDFVATRIINNGISYAAPATGDNFWMVVFENEENKKAQEANNAPSDSELKNTDKDDEDFYDAGQIEIPGYIPINQKEEEGELLNRVVVLNDYKDANLVFDFSVLKTPNQDFYTQDTLDRLIWRDEVAGNDFEAENIINSDTTGSVSVSVAGEFGYTVCHHSLGPEVFGLFIDDDRGASQRIYIKTMCNIILQSLEKIEDERNQIIGSVLGKAGEQEAAIYKQMHSLYHQWQALAYDSGDGFCSSTLEKGGDIATRLENKYGDNHVSIFNEEDIKKGGKDSAGAPDGNGLPDGAFVYEFPLQRIVGPKEKPIQVRDAIISLEPLYKPNADTSVLNIIQQICTKNNFLFIPIPGNADYLDVSDLYSPKNKNADATFINYFHVLFTPTPESRAKSNDKTPLALQKNHKEYNTNSFLIKYGSPDNQIVSNIQVGTEDNKVTAESIVNLQRLVDNENQNKKVTTDCSVLPILEGRSYTASIDMIGNAQVYPMQFFFMENSPLFGGLYQVMKVKHSITPNDMKTSVEGMRMRFTPENSYGSIAPITLDTYRSLGPLGEQGTINQGFTAIDIINMKGYSEGIGGIPITGEVYKEQPAPNTSQKEVIDKIIKYANDIGIKDKNRLFCLLVVAKKETGFKPKSEDSNYGLSGVKNTFGGAVKGLTDAQIKALLTPERGGTGQPDSLFNYVYGKKYGNNGYVNGKIEQEWLGPYNDGKDGHRYRGRGLSQVTFKSNYKAIEKNIKKYFPDTTGNVVQNPNLLNEVEYAVKAHIAGKMAQQFGAFSSKIDFLNSPESVHRSNHGTDPNKKIHQGTFKGTKKAFYFCKTDEYIQNALKNFPDYA